MTQNFYTGNLTPQSETKTLIADVRADLQVVQRDISSELENYETVSAHQNDIDTLTQYIIYISNFEEGVDKSLRILVKKIMNLSKALNIFAQISTPDITSNFQNIMSVTDGSLTLVFDDRKKFVLTGLDFTQLEEGEGIGEYISNRLNNEPGFIGIESIGSEISYGSDVEQVILKSWGSKEISFQPTSTGTDISGANYLNLANATVVSSNE